MRLSDFDYSYPSELIAKYPLKDRSASRMMVINRMSQKWSHRIFKAIPEYFKKGDVLVLNNSKVFPCRLFAKKPTGGKVEVFLIRAVEEKVWDCLITDSKRIIEGTGLVFSENLKGTVRGAGGAETRRIQLDYTGSLHHILDTIGHIPLPRYIKRADEVNDRERYQTVFANKTGSVAAPTAGFHFTEKILAELKQKGVEIVFVTLHVGVGTFLPIRAEKIENHTMKGEYFEIPQETAQIINQAKAEKRRVTVVGTTAVRALESCWSERYTEKFIYPPYSFKIVDRLLTNFHQPQSTLLLLVAAFAGPELILSAYQEAIREKYRLFSYGDCMLIE